MTPLERMVQHLRANPTSTFGLHMDRNGNWRAGYCSPGHHEVFVGHVNLDLAITQLIELIG